MMVTVPITAVYFYSQCTKCICALSSLFLLRLRVIFFILVQELFSFIQIFSYLVGTFEFIKTKGVMLGSMTRFVSHITFFMGNRV